MRWTSGMRVGLLMATGLLVARAAGAENDVRKDERAEQRDPSAANEGDRARESARDPASASPPRETGRVGSTPKAAGFPIEGSGPIMPVSPETAITPIEKGDEAQDVAGAGAPAGHIDPALLEPEIQAGLATARLCRLEIARRKRIAPERVRAQTLELRWVILSSGTVGDRVVVATSPVDPDVMTCVKGRMAGWTFTAPTGGQMALRRDLVFK